MPSARALALRCVPRTHVKVKAAEVEAAARDFGALGVAWAVSEAIHRAVRGRAETVHERRVLLTWARHEFAEQHAKWLDVAEQQQGWLADCRG